MSFEDEELLQDFLVEAGEILEQLQEQLVDLENSPSDSDLLNAVFRGFHTIKGGGSFLGLTTLVDVCHIAEDVFNLLRNGDKQVTSHLMDVMLRVLDSLNDMFDALRDGQQPEPAEPELIDLLKALNCKGEAPAEASGAAEPAVVAEPQAAAEPEAVAEPQVEATTPESAPAESPPVAEGDISDDEFEKLLDVLDGDAQQDAQPVASAAEATPAADSDIITEDEFDNLLDELHGEGQFKTPAVSSDSTTDEAPSEQVDSKNDSDDITEDEFEQLLDELHGEGASPTVNSAPVSSPAPATDPATETSDEISEDEFEHLLDELHGEGKFKAGTDAPASSPEPVAEPAPVSAPVAKPEPVAAPPAPEPVSAPAPVAEKKVEKEKPAAPAVAKDKPAKAGKDSAAQGETTVRVDTKRLDDIMNMVGELVLARNRLVTLQSTIEGNEEFAHAIANLDLVTGDLQTSVMKTRMQPIKKVFGRFPRVVRDLARSLKKEVSLELRGEETDLDKNLVEALADPLVHLVRNAVDHGIEDPDTRAANGKSREGTVILSAEQEGDHILLTIQDDGAGMDPDMLRRLAVEKGVMDAEAASRLDDRDAYSLIFAPGFSTKEEISDISGRGVGMDVVKTRIVQLNGSIEIDSTLGKGTLLSIKVPLTLAIMPTLMVMLGAQIFALPLVSVSEIFNLDLTNTNKVDGQKVIMLRDRALPIYFLSDWLEKEGRLKEHPSNGHVVVVSVGDQRVGFVVETLIGQEEVVIKPLGALLHGTKGLAGATITGDGRIALILDVPSLMKAYVRR